MGQAVFSVPAVSLKSTWTSTGTSHTTPSTDEKTSSVVVSGIPTGATNISAVLTYTTTSPRSGAAIREINGTTAASGTNQTRSIPITGNGTITITFRFKANGDNTGTTGVMAFRGPNEGDPMTLTVTWTEPASTWTTPSSVALNSALGLSITNSASGRRHTWNVSFGSASMGWQEISGTSASYTLPLSWASQIPNATSGTGTVHFRTCDSSLNVLSETSRSITVTLPSSVVPSAGALSVAVNNPYVYDSVQYCLQGIHTLTLTLSGDAGVYGSTIRSVFISGGGYSSNSRTLTTNPIQTSGNVTFTATVTDSRGRSNSASVTRYVQPYTPVSIASAVARRADGNYAESGNGTNLYGSVTFVKTEVPGAGVTVITDYKTSTASAYTSLTSSTFAYNDAARNCEIKQAGLLATDASYNVRYTVTDGITTTSYEMIVPTASVYAVFDKDAKTVGFGSYPDTRSSTNNFTVASDWNLYTHGSEILDLIGSINHERLVKYTSHSGDTYVEFDGKNDSSGAHVGIAAVGQYSSTDATECRLSIRADKETGEIKWRTDSKAGTRYGSLLNWIYPVGSIYMSTSGVSPAEKLGGTWEQIYDRMLIGGGNAYSCGSTGGEATHVLSVSEMPSHTHTYQIYASAGTTTQWCFDNVSKTAISDTGYIGYTGGSQAHNNMPPYLAVYMWKRVA